MRVVDDGFFANLRAVVLSCTRRGDALVVGEVLAGFH